MAKPSVKPRKEVTHPSRNRPSEGPRLKTVKLIRTVVRGFLKEKLEQGLKRRKR